MINYSIYLRTNPLKKEEAPKAYGVAQYNSVMDINKFAAHIATHGCVYSRADIAAVLTMAVDCLYEQLLAGQKIELGDLGSFSISLHCKGADSIEDFNPEQHVKRVKARWEMGPKFLNLTDEAEFNLVPNRAIQAALVRAIKAGDTTVDLVTGSASGDNGTEGSDPDNGHTDPDNGGNGGTDPGNGESNPL